MGIEVCLILKKYRTIMPVGQWFDGFYDKFFRWVVQTVITKSKVYLKKNRGGSK